MNAFFYQMPSISAGTEDKFFPSLRSAGRGDIPHSKRSFIMLPSLPPKRAFEMVQNGEARLVDVRESSEYAEKFIPGSRLIPLSRIQCVKDIPR